MGNGKGNSGKETSGIIERKKNGIVERKRNNKDKMKKLKMVEIVEGE